LKASTVAYVLDGPGGPDAASSVAEGVWLGSYRFDKYKTPDPKEKVPPRAAELIVVSGAVPGVKKDLERVLLLAECTNAARDLVNEPPTALVPADLAKAARAAARRSGLSATVLTEVDLRKQGYEGTLTVGKGSPHRPCMIILRHKPARVRAVLHLALVGKAVMFDTGGYCLKPPKDMWRMKGDMAGGAAVISAMEAIARLRLPVRVTGIVPSVVNAVDGGAMLPGDVIRAKNGTTVMVDNTDAEGRLILMDALIRAKEEGATHAVDMATLTGAVVNALGTSMSGVLGTSQDLVDRIIAAGAACGEMFWQLPLHEEYAEMLKSDTADVNNSSSSPRAGAITAALFLQKFVHPSLQWAHLDIAGTYMNEKPWRCLGAGATGFGVRTLVGLAEGFTRGK
jgi:leucyl aminopeptidase